MLAEYFIGLVLYCCRERSRRVLHRLGFVLLQREKSPCRGCFRTGQKLSQTFWRTGDSEGCLTGANPVDNGPWNISCGTDRPPWTREDRPLGGLWNISCGTAPLQWSMEHLLWDCPPSLVYGTSPVGLPPLSGLWNISCGTAPLQWSMEHLLISCGTAPPQWSVEHLL